MPGLLVDMVYLISRMVALAPLLLVAALGQPMAALAHAGGEPLIHVPADHVEPGQPFQLIASDLGENATVTLELAIDETKATLGTVVAGPDGHFQTMLTLPAPFPEGYAQLTATSDDGSSASAWVRVGTGPDLGALPATNEDPPFVDPSLLLLPAGALAVVGLWWFRGMRRKASQASRR